MTVTVPSGRRSRTKLIWLVPAVGFMIVLAPVVLLAGAGNPPCSSIAPSPTGFPAGSGAWIATAYGPPWDAINGGGVTATGLNLTAGTARVRDRRRPHGDPAAELRARHPQPVRHPTRLLRRRHRRRDHRPPRRHLRLGRPRRPRRLGRPARHRHPGAEPGHRQPPRRDHPDRGRHPARDRDGQRRGAGCSAAGGPLPLTPGQTAKILPSGLAAAPQDAPRAVKLAIAAGNQLIDKPYIYGGGHGQPLTELAAGYDCSGSTSFVLHGAGVFGDYAEDSTELESYGQAGPGQWITVYANSAHAFIDVAGIVLDTAWYAPVQPTSPGSGPRWQPASIIPAQYAGDQAAGNGGFVQRHPAGL